MRRWRIGWVFPTSNGNWKTSCLRYLEPETYYELVENVKQKRKERQAFIETAIPADH
jgi:GTP pyrophosphokinase